MPACPRRPAPVPVRIGVANSARSSAVSLTRYTFRMTALCGSVRKGPKGIFQKSTAVPH